MGRPSSCYQHAWGFALESRLPRSRRLTWVSPRISFHGHIFSTYLKSRSQKMKC